MVQIRRDSFAVAAECPARWEAMLRDVEEAFQVKITVHDQMGFLSDDNGRLLMPYRNLHPHAVCQRHTPGLPGNRCVKHCVDLVRKRAQAERAPFVTACWKGLQDVVAPIFRNDANALILFAGPFRNPAHPGPSGRGVTEEIRSLWKRLPVLEEERAGVLARVLMTLGYGLLSEGEAWAGLRFASPDRRVRVQAFLYTRAHEDVALSDLAQHLHLSASRTGHLVKELFGLGFKALLTQERLRRAQALLRSTPLSIEDIARRVGFSSQHYFTRAFHRHVGRPPGAFRAQAE